MTLPEPTDPIPSGDSADDARVADAVLDVLLAEVLTGQAPPDQSAIIIERLQRPVVCSVTKRKSGSRSSRPRPSVARSSTSTWRIAWVTCAAILVCAGVVAGIRFRNGVITAKNANAPQGIDGVTKPDVEVRGATSADRFELDPPAERHRVPAPPIALADASPGAEIPPPDSIEMFDEGQSQARIALVPAPRPPAQPLTLVSTSLSDHLNQYWERAGVQPTKLLSPEEIAQRLTGRLRVNVKPHAIGDSEAMLTLLARPQNTKRLAGPVLEAISSRPDGSLTRPVDQQMMAQVAKTLGDGRGFDRLVASWFVEGEDGRAESKESDVETVPSIGELLRPLGQHEAIVSTAALALGTDMRCVRCHDLPTSGRDAITSQHDYWQFAAALSPWLGWQTNGPSGWFYDMPDGRRRLAQAELSSDWGQQLVGSRPLAEGLVGAMWEMVHGRPLTSTPYDLTGCANDFDLQQLRNELTDDLIASDFNLLRTISLIMTDSIVGRRTPDAMTPSGLLTATADEWVRAVSAVQSFAAAPPESMPSSLDDRVSLVLGELPHAGSVDATSALLAQPLGSSGMGFDDPQGAKKFLPVEMPEPSPAVLAGLPMRATIVMPAWMGKLPDFDSRLAHIGNLAGLHDVPDDVKTLAGQMREAGLDEPLILQRIWWIIRPRD